jgi:SAM-dependent methyltransferase
VSELLREAAEHDAVGWDFSWLGDRLVTEPLPWDYTAMLAGRARESPDLLDLGTGGGEFLASLEHRPPRTVATESWAPNVEIAGERLRQLGVTVVAVDAAPDNDRQDDATEPRLPFPSASFALVAGRHESYLPREVARVLTPGGTFLTQQVGGDYGEYYDALELPRPSASAWNRELAVTQLERAGLEIVESGETRHATTFADVGALAWYLKAIPWVVDGFSIERHASNLERLDRRLQADGPLTIREPAFWVAALKAGPGPAFG